MDTVFTLDFHVRDYELDQYGVVNNAVYLNYLEHTRHAFLVSIGTDPAAVARTGNALALSEIHVHYRGSLRSRDAFRSELRIGEIRGARVVIQQRIQKIPDKRVILDARAVAVFLDEAGRPLRVSPEHVAAFTPYLITADASQRTEPSAD